jgi:hypothetical protein
MTEIAPFPQPHVAGASERIVVDVTVTDADFSPSGVTSRFAIFRAGGTSNPLYAVDGTFTLVSGTLYRMVFFIPRNATGNIPPNQYEYQASAISVTENRPARRGTIRILAKPE